MSTCADSRTAQNNAGDGQVRSEEITHLMLLARLTTLSSPTTDRLLLETMEKWLEET